MAHGPGATRAVSVDDVVDARYRAIDVDNRLAQRARDALDRDGVCILDGFLRVSALAALQEHIREVARDEATCGEERLVKGYVPDPIRRLAASPLLVSFVNLVLGASTGARSLARAPIVEADLSPGINVMREAGDAKPFHFDGTYLNLMLPVLNSPSTRPRRGQLTIYPNIRSFDETFADRYVVTPAARLPLRRVFRARTVEYVPGDLCMFYGYRTLHGVAPLDEAGLRCVFAINVNRQ